MEVRRLTSVEYDAALSLAWAVFWDYEAPDYSEEGVNKFCAILHDPEYFNSLCYYGAIENEMLVGILATNHDGEHISLFFVDGKYHNKGIGKQLFFLACKDNKTGKMTVNSSPFAVDVYHHLGFKDTAEEQTNDGIRFTPMVCVLHNDNCSCKRNQCPRFGNCVECREHHKTVKGHSVYCERPKKKERGKR